MEQKHIQSNSQPKKVIIIGGGLSGLTAAEKILKAEPNTTVLVLEAMDEVGGRTYSKLIKDAKFDLGGTWVGRTQKHVQKLAERAKNELMPQFHEGAKILDIQKKVSSYRSNIPLDVGLPALIQMQFAIWKLDRMANKLNPENPRDYVLSCKWDSETVRSWMEKNVGFVKVKILIECAVRAVLGAETDEVSFLFFLWYVRQNGGVENLINIENGLQEKKMTKGSQELSLFLRKKIEKKNGEIKTNCFVRKVTNGEHECIVEDIEGNEFKADYIVMAMPPARVNKISFEPQLSRDRRFMNERNLMGSISKVLFLYDKPYWREKGFSGETLSDCLKTPVFNAYDDCRYKENGEVQPAMVIFLNASVDREWSGKRAIAEKAIAETLAEYFGEKEMLNPLEIHWKVWNEEKSLNGGPIAFFPPGVLSKIENLRKPEGRIHWAGTEMARVSQGFMDGAIESGIRVSEEIIKRIRNEESSEEKVGEEKDVSYWYKNIVHTPKKFFEWI